MNRTKGSYPVVIRMAPELHEALKACAEREERSLAQTIRHALRAYVERTESS